MSAVYSNKHRFVVHVVGCWSMKCNNDTSEASPLSHKWFIRYGGPVGQFLLLRGIRWCRGEKHPPRVGHERAPHRVSCVRKIHHPIQHALRYGYIGELPSRLARWKLCVLKGKFELGQWKLICSLIPSSHQRRHVDPIHRSL